ncbi:MAG TPA: RNA polymerase sigma factor [Terriglobia bacterium]|nr:RNA polymerase sigma factor [Terriglobia bacterium]
MQSDEQLMLEFKGGSNEAFEELFSRYRNPIYGFFRRRLNHGARAEELAQETFVIIIRGVERYETTATFRTYIFSIALKQLWSERRKGLREARTTEMSLETGPSTDPTTGLWIRDAISRMDPDHREVLMLREYEQLSYEEIAEVLAIPLNTVRSRLLRARNEVRILLDEQSMKGVSR